MLIANSDLSASILPRSPLLPNPVETLDESSSPIASIGADDVQPLDLSSPNRNRDGGQVSLSMEEVSTPHGSLSTTPLDETLTVPSLVSLEHGECSDAQVMQEPRIHLCDSDSPSTPNVSPRYDTDDDDSTNEFWNQPLCRLVQEPLIEPPCVGAGLWNLGNSCFVNSVLQCLTHTVPLIDSFCSYKYPDPCNCGNESFCVLRTLRGHMEVALLTSRYSISPFYFLNNLNYFSPDFLRFEQQDAHEFLQAFLDKLEICCLDRSSATDNISSQDNIVQHIFGGRLVSGLRCCSCNFVSETFENSLGLSLEIEDVDNLESALDSFTRVEKLEEQMTCDNCEEKVSKEKQLLLDELPLVVTFHLKRFKNNGYFMEKIFNHVEFPLELDLQPYMSNSQNNQVPTKYYLYALVEHLGSLAYGHYSSYVRSAPKIWHEFNDKKVTRVDEDYVLSQDSYIVFYAKEGTSWFRTIFEELHPSLQPSLENSSPNSVLDPTNGECLSEISNENVCNSNKPCDSAEVPDLVLVKTEENCVSLSKESNEDVYQSAESSDEESLMTDILEPYDLDDDSSCPCTETEADSCLAIERATTGDDYVPFLMVQNQVSSPKQHEGTFQIQLEQLETKKNQEDSCEQPLSVSDVADFNETEIVHGGLMKKPSPQARELDQAIPKSGSLPKKLKTE